MAKTTKQTSDVATPTDPEIPAAESAVIAEPPVTAPTKSDDQIIAEKMRAGLSRDQATQVLQMQREHDAYLSRQG